MYPVTQVLLLLCLFIFQLTVPKSSTSQCPSKSSCKYCKSSYHKVLLERGPGIHAGNGLQWVHHPQRYSLYTKLLDGTSNFTLERHIHLQHWVVTTPHTSRVQMDVDSWELNFRCQHLSSIQTQRLWISRLLLFHKNRLNMID